MKTILKLLFILNLIICTSLSAASDKFRVAIMDLNPIGISKSTADAVSDILRTEIFNTGYFTVLERAQMTEILKEQEFQLSGCTETECAIQIGKLLSANKVLVGTVSKIGNSYVINARIVDVEKGSLDFAEKYVAYSEDALIHGCEVFAKKLSARMRGEKYVEPEELRTRQPSTTEELKTTQPSKVQEKVIIDLYGGLSVSSSLDLYLSREFPQPPMTKNELGLVGSFADGFYEIEWKDAKVKNNKIPPIGIRMLFGSTGCLSGAGYLGLEILYTTFKIEQQLTKFYLDGNDAGDFKFGIDDYFNVSTFYFGGHIVISPQVSKFFAPFANIGLGLSLNSYNAPYIKGYTQSSSFSSPSEESALIGLGVILGLGFRFNFSNNLGMFFETRLFLNSFEFKRNIDTERDVATFQSVDLILGFTTGNNLFNE